MNDSYTDVIVEMRAMQDRVRNIRERHCDLKGPENRRYNALSRVVSSLGAAIDDMEDEDAVRA